MTDKSATVSGYEVNANGQVYVPFEWHIQVVRF